MIFALIPNIDLGGSKAAISLVSSLHYNSHSIKFAWSFPDGEIMSYLIKPEPDWVDWDDYAENYIHGISRAQLEAEGLPAVEVVEKMTAALAGHNVYTSYSMFDAKCVRSFSITTDIAVSCFLNLVTSRFYSKAILACRAYSVNR